MTPRFCFTLGSQGVRRERGASLVEAALLAPVFLMIIFGIFEFGLLLRNDLAMGHASIAGARAGAVAADSAEADFLVLRAIDHGIDAWGAENLDFVVVFRADGPEDDVPAACLTGPVTDVCNYYRPVDFSLPFEDASGVPTAFWQCTATAVDDFWCPADRPTSLSWLEPVMSPYNDGPAYLGVYIQGRHDFVTRFFGDGLTLDETQILRLEPRRR